MFIVHIVIILIHVLIVVVKQDFLLDFINHRLQTSWQHSTPLYNSAAIAEGFSWKLDLRVQFLLYEIVHIYKASLIHSLFYLEEQSLLSLGCLH